MHRQQQGASPLLVLHTSVPPFLQSKPLSIPLTAICQSNNPTIYPLPYQPYLPPITTQVFMMVALTSVTLTFRIKGGTEVEICLPSNTDVSITSHRRYLRYMR